MPTHTLTFHIAAIGPSDTEEDVEAIRLAVEELSDEFASRGVTLSFHHWSRLPPGIGESAQGYIDQSISWADMDFVVGLIWDKFGTPVAGSLSGTEHEYRQIHRLFKQRGQPDLLFYFRSPSSSIDPTQRDLIAAFKNDVRTTSLTNSYGAYEELRAKVVKHLREKILQRLATNDQYQRRLGPLPSNRRITVELMVFAEFPPAPAGIPTIIIFKNFRGEEFIFDTRTMDPQPFANWIARSMGYAAEPGKTLCDYLDECNHRNLHECAEDESRPLLAQLWLGNILFCDHPGLKMKKLNIALANNLGSGKAKKILSGESPFFLPLPPPQIVRDADGNKKIQF